MERDLKGFAGNAEGTDILPATFDVFVTDGFTGNVVLKTIEGTAHVLFSQIKSTLSSSTTGKLAGLLVKSRLRELKGRMSAEATGGAPLLGLKGACIIGHGSSSPRAIANGIKVAAQAIREDISAAIEEEVSRLAAAADEVSRLAAAAGEGPHPANAADEASRPEVSVNEASHPTSTEKNRT
jgi:glycerol-3-phosphate acyltransferase PlsX